MNILVVGSTGQVGSKLIESLAKMGHTVYAGARNPDRIEKKENIYPVEFNLHDDVAILSEKLDGMDVVYCVSGSRGTDLIQTDLFGNTKLMMAANQKKIKRFIHLSAIFSTEPDRWPEGMEDYFTVKFFSDNWLINNTDLNYTILQPSYYTKDEGTGLIAVNVNERGPIAVADVAETLVEVLDKENTYKKKIRMHYGDTPIKEAIAGI